MRGRGDDGRIRLSAAVLLYGGAMRVFCWQQLIVWVEDNTRHNTFLIGNNRTFNYLLGFCRLPIVLSSAIHSHPSAIATCCNPVWTNNTLSTYTYHRAMAYDPGDLPYLAPRPPP
ncbi:hypothetical protein EVG20_g3468 [Dentipellis fragilis]|uniref:Uncharacterized protein n=1 Tax=Dentipellis fragilis TaxID=205917 RepID=A0A4Y9Z3U5_9AGAM|nr:hypothetical protein EVG20_g3468 [Dentipellis fragilis]